MEKENYILTYYQKIKDGTICAGKWIHLLYEYIVQGIELNNFYFDNKKATSAIHFIETKCHHSEGKYAPGKLKLELWQKALISLIFGIVDENGMRQFREIVLIVARKNGKSLLASSIIANCLYNEGEYGAKGFCVAPKLDQADIIYNTFLQSATLDKSLEKITKSRKSDIYIKETNSSLKKIAFNAKKSDGFNPSICVCDEIAAWEGDKGIKQYEVMQSALGAREQPLLLSVSTAGYVNDGIFDELMKRGTRFLLGDSNEKRLLPVIYMIDDVEKWNDINELQKSNPNLNVSVSVDFVLEQIAIAESTLSRKAEFLCKMANIKQNSSLAWLRFEDVNKCCGEPLNIDDFKDCYCVGGIDLSQTTDLTACVILIEKNEEFYVFAHFFIPAAKIDEAIARDGVPYNAYVQRGFLTLSGDNYIDYKDCFKWFTNLIEQHQIFPLQTGYDRYSSQYLVNDMKQYGFHMDDVWQGTNLHPMIQELEGMVKDGKIHIGDNDLLKSHLLNSAVKMSHDKGRGQLVKIAPTMRIDGTAALLDSMAVRSKWSNQIGEQLKNRG